MEGDLCDLWILWSFFWDTDAEIEENHHPFSQDHLRPQRNDLKNRRSAPQEVPSVKISDI